MIAQRTVPSVLLLDAGEATVLLLAKVSYLDRRLLLALLVQLCRQVGLVHLGEERKRLYR